MPVMKKHLTPLGKKGAINMHQGKGSQMAAMPNRRQIKQLGSPASTMNNYAKADPMPNMPMDTGFDSDSDGM